MNRAHDLKATLLQNINDNFDYPNVEFVVLNYNSSDEMHKFMASNRIKYLIKMGIVKYLITKRPKYYSASHSRNIAFKNANGNIVINVDADTYTGKGFAELINKLADIQPENALFSVSQKFINGRIGMYKNDFLRLGGYNEKLSGYGGEDSDLVLRAMNSGFKMITWGGFGDCFLRRIKTSPDSSVENMFNKNRDETIKNNRCISISSVSSGSLVANSGEKWGYAPDLIHFHP